MFTPVRSGYAAEEIAAQIEDAILLHTLNPGDQLPSERELVASFEASRGTIREALSILKQKGLITIKRGYGGGTFIADMTVDKASEGLAFLIRQKRISVDELAEFRECAEGFAASLAAERSTKEEIAELKAVVSQMKDLLSKGEVSWEEFYPLERKAHETLIRQCKNTIFQLVLTTIHLNIYPYLLRERNALSGAELQSWDKHGTYDAYSDWLEIIDGLENKEATRVGSIIRSHVSRYNRTIREEPLKTKHYAQQRAAEQER